MTAPRPTPTGSARPRRRIGRLPASAPSERYCVHGCARVYPPRVGFRHLVRGLRLCGSTEDVFGVGVCARAVRCRRAKDRHVGRSLGRTSVGSSNVGARGRIRCERCAAKRRRSRLGPFCLTECANPFLQVCISLYVTTPDKRIPSARVHRRCTSTTIFD